MRSEKDPPRPSAGKHRGQSKKRTGRRRSVPLRTCVGCRTVSSKRAMVRVVRTSDGTVEIDPTGRRSGRGAYLCQQKSCWEQAIKRRSLGRALKIALDEATKAALIDYAQTLPEESDVLRSTSGETTH